MGVTKVNPLFEHLSGALAKPKKKDGHKCGEYVIATHRVAETTNPNCQRVYIKSADAYNRSTPVSDHEIEIRTLFTERLEWVNARAKNLSTLSQDQVAYLAQKDQPNGAKTWKSYLWKLAKAAVTGE